MQKQNLQKDFSHEYNTILTVYLMVVNCDRRLLYISDSWSFSLHFSRPTFPILIGKRNIK